MFFLVFLEALGGILEALGGVLGALGSVLGASWGILGGLGGVLEAKMSQDCSGIEKNRKKIKNAKHLIKPMFF